MSSKAAKRRAKKAAQQIADGAAVTTPAPVPQPSTPKPERPKAVRPTPQRIAKGLFRMPTGPDRRQLPAHDVTHDAVARMHHAGLLSDAQEAAARDWQLLKARVREELSISQGRSCLDMTPCGHDDSDGDPELMQHWRRVEAELGSWKVGSLDWTCVLNHPPGNLRLFRAALDQFSRC